MTGLPPNVDESLNKFISGLKKEYDKPQTNDESGPFTEFLVKNNLVDPPHPRWRTDALERMNTYDENNIIVQRTYKIVLVVKIVLMLVGIIWLVSKMNRNLKDSPDSSCNKTKSVSQDNAKKNAFDHVYEVVNTILLYTMGCFIIYVALFLMIRLRRFGPSFFRHSPTVAVFQYWEGTFIWWFLVLLIICSICAMVPQWNKYMKMFF